MRINHLIQIASTGYPDMYIAECWDNARQCPLDVNCGDTLALFIARELAETFDPDGLDVKQRKTAADALRKAVDNIHSVIQVLEEACMTNYSLADYLDAVNDLLKTVYGVTSDDVGMDLIAVCHKTGETAEECVECIAGKYNLMRLGVCYV